LAKRKTRRNGTEVAEEDRSSGVLRKWEYQN